MAAVDGIKKWWSNNPVLACGLGSLGLMAFLFLFPFQSAFGVLAGIMGAVFFWVPDAFAGWLNVMEGNRKLYFASVGFFVVFFACLSSKKSTRSLAWGLGISLGFFAVSCMAMIVGWEQSESPARGLMAHVNTLENQEALLTSIEFSTVICKPGRRMEMTPLKTNGPAEGMQVFLCEKKADGRYVVTKRSLSEVDWIGLSCLQDRACDMNTWKAAYSPAKKGIVFETSTGVIRTCKNYVKDLASSFTQVTVNGKPADPAQCGYGTNTITAVYSLSWLKE